MEDNENQKAESLCIFTVESNNLAITQRLIALRHAFMTIDAYAIPSLSPDEMNRYDELKQILINRYGDNVELDEENKLRF